MFDSRQNLKCQAVKGRFVTPAIRLFEKKITQALSLNILHDDEGTTFVLKPGKLIQSPNIGMAKTLGELEFRLKFMTQSRISNNTRKRSSKRELISRLPIFDQRCDSKLVCL
jgi:hypothetical protein